MELTLTLPTLVGLFVSLAVLAAIPSISVLVVSSRAATYGFMHGAATTFGIVLVDIIFISIALLGMALVLPWLGKWAVLIRLLAAGYLFWLAWRLWCFSDQKKSSSEVEDSASLTSSFLLGVMVTLADHKAILFYMGFFPAWMDLSLLTLSDTVVIFLLTFLAIGGVKMSYAYLSAKSAKRYFISRASYFNKFVAMLSSLVALMMLLSLWWNL
ncbi:LysE family translocator [Methylophaga sp.]|uniref:LysE family translocator n=1 Tax=Methylophaga sp. TaxID=2024840 RepID=UPI003A8E9A4F